MCAKEKKSVAKPSVTKPDLSWAEISAIVYIIEHLKDQKMTKLGLNPDRVVLLRKAQKKMSTALEKYIDAGK